MVAIVLRSLYAICLLAGASTHIWTIATHGISWDHGGAPLFSRIYWTSLAAFDIAAAVLLYLRPRTGLALTVVIIVSDVVHNTWIIWRSPEPDWTNWMYLLQLLFCVFVLATVKRAFELPKVAERTGD